jgi:hypothetical protein
VTERKETMKKGERDALTQLIRRQAQVKKTAAIARSKELFADLEHQLGTIYRYDDDAVWKAATEAAQEEVARAQAIVAARCKELGIPEDFAPSLSFGWSGRGANGVASRRAELRKMGASKIMELEARALAKIEADSVELQAQIVSHGLTSEAAVAFLEALPSVAELMKPVEPVEIQQWILGVKHDRTQQQRRLGWIRDEDDGCIGP